MIDFSTFKRDQAALKDQPWCPAHGRYEDALAGCPRCRLEGEQAAHRAAVEAGYASLPGYVAAWTVQRATDAEIREKIEDEIANDPGRY